jgi:hypothetical protein
MEFLRQYISYTIEMLEVLMQITSMRHAPDSLTQLKQRLAKNVYVVMLRVHKSTTALMKVFQPLMELNKSSLFDKNYILNSILNAQSLSEEDANAEYLMLTPYGRETDALLADGGIAKKTVKQITEKSRTIKEFIDLRISDLLETL